MAPPIGDYGIIGDCRSAALISKTGSLDWLCWPWFDSGSMFAAILDVEKGGFWRIAPSGPYSSTRRYIPETNVLETEFHTVSGVLRLTDCMPVYNTEYEQKNLVPDRELLRIVECVSGVVQLDAIYQPAPKYASCNVRWRKKDPLGIRVEFTGGALWMRSDLNWQVRENHAACNSTMRAGQRRYCSLVMMEHGPAVLSPLGHWSDTALAQTISWWKNWASKCTYQDTFRDEVVRSALTLKLLNFAPSGATVAAATMSLPERVGGDLNWDYRYCWLRDASMTVTAMFGLGYHEEAEAFIEWLLHSTNRTQPRLLVTYTVYGRLTPKEWEVKGWSGYRNSRPVRVGNDARKQLQLDVYGEVLSAAVQLDEYNKYVDRSTARVLRGIGKYIHGHWQLPDKGIWEPRTADQQHTHSKLMCWLAMDSLLRLHDSGILKGLNRAEVRDTIDEIRREIEQKAWNEEKQIYTAIFGGDQVDASLLLLSKHGFEAADSPRMQSTYRRICDELRAGPGLLYRYRNGISPGEAAFGICCFWGAEFLALGGGTVQEAEEEFRNVLRYRNDLGLYGEEIDPATGAVVGNFPQGFTHIGLINAALSLADRKEKAKHEGKAA